MKYNIGHKFVVISDGNHINGEIIKNAALDEFGCDFHYSEINYVVKFDIDDKPIATYNILRDCNDKLRYNYIMTESDLDKLTSI